MVSSPGISRGSSPASLVCAFCSPKPHSHNLPQQGYSCLITRLQHSFRNVYNLQGNLCLDCIVAYCCPASAVSRMEMEATVHQEEDRLLQRLPSALEESGSSASSGGEGYTNNTPMIYPKPIVDHLRPEQPDAVPKTKDSHSQSASRNGNSDHDVTVLDTITERSREPSIGTPVLSVQPAAEAPALKNPKRHQLQDDAPVAFTARTKTWPLLKYLGEKWYVVPPTKEGAAPGSDGAKSNGPVGTGPSREPQKNEEQVNNNPTIIALKASPRHALLKDQQYITATLSKHTADSLGDDVTAPASINGSRFKEHLLSADQPTHAKAPNCGSLPLQTSDASDGNGSRVADKHDVSEDNVSKGVISASNP